jgi:cellulose biosynthesis protein BcsQ
MVILPIVSLKGGVGKTTVALNFANLLANKGKTLILDTDPQNSVAALLCKNFDKGFAEYILDDIDIKELIQISNHNQNLHLVPAGKNAILHLEEFEKKMNTVHLKSFLEEASKDYDYLVIDTPPTLNEQNISILKIIDFFIIVIKPEPASVASLALFFEFFHKKGLGNKYQVIINEMEANELYADFHTYIQAITDNNVLTTIPIDMQVADSQAQCIPTTTLHPESVFSTTMKEALEKLGL